MVYSSFPLQRKKLYLVSDVYIIFLIVGGTYLLWKKMVYTLETEYTSSSNASQRGVNVNALT